MQLFRDLNEVRVSHPTVLTIGTFDGLHRGHQSLIEQLKQAATRRQVPTAVITFHPRPKAVFAPHLAGDDYLTTPDERVALFEQLGVDVLALIPFTLDLAQLTAAQFVEKLKAQFDVVELWTGHDFALGKGREGNQARLAELGQEFGYTVHTFAPFLLSGEVVSSTRIREYLREGQVTQAADLLGRHYTVCGTVVQGDQRGRTIGYPTANLAIPATRLVPANGVYATQITRLTTGQTYPSVTNVGVRPSFDGQTRTIEAHIIDFAADIYGEMFELAFVERLRPEKKFAGLDALIHQIEQDAMQARKLLLG